MFQLRKAEERGSADHGWLQTSHSFSFAGYHDPNHRGFRSLRVINEDQVAPGRGFGTHGHDNMEIISYVLEGALEHKDSMGNGEILKPGELQRISAGSGITHSEFNPSLAEPVHFYQIWITPNVRNTHPTYQQKRFDLEDKLGKLRVVASPSGRDGSLSILQDVEIYLSVVNGQPIRHQINPSRHLWIQVINGRLSVNRQQLSASDGMAISDESEVTISGDQGSEFMMFDLA